ncbi:uncharacterized protein ATC70_013020 [Mucor velutinosus]|uniref:Uncharacterized protein n=1 Tax=Mucor velutinosus TaxID=708070 RepID=A0AAN7DEW9_9FUNG|nr:hypothetical protein ATC70_013020 [Mucor velutinosus]
MSENRSFVSLTNNKRVKITETEENTNSSGTPCIHDKTSNIPTPSPYQTILAFDSSEEITAVELQILNSRRKLSEEGPVSAQLLVGCIISDQNQALLVNGLEIYHRDASVDQYCERVLRIFCANAFVPILQSPTSLQSDN